MQPISPQLALKIRAMQLGIHKLYPLDTHLIPDLPLATRLYLTAIYAFHPDIDESPYIASILDTLDVTPKNELRKYGAFSVECAEYLILALLIRHADKKFLPRIFDRLLLQWGFQKIQLFHLMLPRMTDDLWRHIIHTLQTKHDTHLFRAIRRYMPFSADAIPSHQPAPEQAEPEIPFVDLLRQPLNPDDNDNAQLTALLAHIPHLNGAQQQQLLDYLAQSKQFPQIIEIITALFPTLNQDTQVQAYRLVIQAVETLPEADTEFQPIAWLQPLAEKNHDTFDFRLEKPLYDFVAVSACDLSSADIQRLVTVIYRVNNAQWRINTLMEILDYVDESTQTEIYDHCFASIRQIYTFFPDMHEDEYRAPMLQNLVHIAPDGYLPQALEIANQFESNMEKSYVLHGIALRLQGDQRVAVFKSALNTAFTRPLSRHTMPMEPVAFLRLLPHLPETLMDEALELIRNYSPLGFVDDPEDVMFQATQFERKNGLTAITPYLSADTVRELLEET